MRSLVLLVCLCGLACDQGGALPPASTVVMPAVVPMPAVQMPAPMPAAPAIVAAPLAPFTIETGPLTVAEVAPTCAPTTGDAGSLHANVLYETIALTPTAKTRQAFDCGGTPVGVLYFLYATETDAMSGAEVAGASLWGSSGPSAEHPDEVLRAGPVIAVVSSHRPGPIVALLATRRGFSIARGGATANAAAVPASRPADLDAPAVAALKASIDCASPVEARYCTALDAFVAGRPPALAPAALVGASLFVRRGRSTTDPTNAEESSYLVLGNTGVKYGEVTPSNPDEARQIQAMLVQLRAGAPIPATDPVRQYVQSLASQPLPSATVSRQSLVYDAQQRIYIRDIGTAIVVVEFFAAPAPYYVGIFPRP